MAEVIAFPISAADKKEKFIGDYLMLFYNPMDLVIKDMTIVGQSKDEDYLVQIPGLPNELTPGELG